jgi:outer membrane murein-binding lipoprotein Lpp
MIPPYKPSKAERLKPFIWPGVAILLLAAAAGVYFWQHQDVDRLNSRVGQLNSKVSSLQSQAQTAQQQLAQAQTSEKKSDSQTAAAPSSCLAADMKLSLGQPNGTAGTSYIDAIFTNTSTEACTLQGYPEVTLTDSNNQTLGQQATQSSSETAALITVQPKHTAHAAVGFPDPGALSAGACSQAANINVTLPGDSSVLQTATSQQYCPGFSVSAIESGS